MSCPSKTILIIEDNQDIRESTAELLEMAGYCTFAASNAPDGLKLALEVKPDVIICDIIMKGMDGYYVFKTLQGHESTKYIKFIFASAQTQREELSKAREMGVKHYLTKPFDEVQLMSCIVD